MKRGFVVLFVPVGADISKPENHQAIASIGGSELEVAEAFATQYANVRQLVGIISLEEIEDHRDMILALAAQENIELDRAPLPPAPPIS